MAVNGLLVRASVDENFLVFDDWYVIDVERNISVRLWSLVADEFGISWSCVNLW